MGFSGLWVVWSPLGAPGEKKRENQMYLQNYLAKFSKIFKILQKISAKINTFFFLQNPEKCHESLLKF